MIRTKIATFVVYLCLLLGGEAHASPNSPEPVKLGAVYSLTGHGAVDGNGELNGVQLAIREINSAGGVNGRPLKLFVEDNRSDFQRTATAFRKLVGVDRISLFLGPNWTEFAEIVAPIAHSQNVLMITATGYVDGLTTGRDTVFSLMPAHELAVQRFARFISHKNHRKLALLVSQNAYFEAIARGLKSYMKKEGLEFTEEIGIAPEDTDFRSHIPRLRADGIDGIVAFLIEGGAVFQFVKQAREFRLEIPVYHGPSPDTDELLVENKHLLNGHYFFSYRMPTEEVFLRKYRKSFASEPTLGSGKAYDSVYLLKEAMEQCGFEVDQVKRCVGNSKFNGITGAISFDSEGRFAGTHDITRVFRVADGEYLPVAG